MSDLDTAQRIIDVLGVMKQNLSDAKTQAGQNESFVDDMDNEVSARLNTVYSLSRGIADPLSTAYHDAELMISLYYLKRRMHLNRDLRPTDVGLPESIPGVSIQKIHQPTIKTNATMVACDRLAEDQFGISAPIDMAYAGVEMQPTLHIGFGFLISTGGLSIRKCQPAKLCNFNPNDLPIYRLIEQAIDEKIEQYVQAQLGADLFSFPSTPITTRPLRLTGFYVDDYLHINANYYEYRVTTRMIRRRRHPPQRVVDYDRPKLLPSLTSVPGMPVPGAVDVVLGLRTSMLLDYLGPQVSARANEMENNIIHAIGTDDMEYTFEQGFRQSFVPYQNGNGIECYIRYLKHAKIVWSPPWPFPDVTLFDDDIEIDIGLQSRGDKILAEIYATKLDGASVGFGKVAEKEIGVGNDNLFINAYLTPDIFVIYMWKR